MKRIKTIGVLLAAVAVLTSCLNSSQNEVTLYDDAVILSFTLGTVNQYTHKTTTAGTDTVVKTTTAGSNYAFHIDQLKREIYNTDSLPVGADARHLLCTITTRNSGMVLIKSTTSDSLFYYSSTDSIDFSVPRRFYVYATDGSGFTEYTVRVNVHQEEANDFVWQQSDSIAAAAAITPDTTTPALPEGFRQLIGHSTKEWYALSGDNLLMVSRDNGATWQQEQLDEDASLLPVQDLALVCYPMLVADSTDYVLLVGNRSLDAYPQESVAMVWRKIVDYSSNAPANKWVYMERDDVSRHMLPRMKNIALTRYDDTILAIGGAGIGGATVAPWATIYQSRDNGITWKENALYKMPAGFDDSAEKVGFYTDKQNCLWLLSGGTGQVWHGRLNRLGWANQ
jgi:hypothetical protein